MSTLVEIEAAIQQLTPQESRELREWLSSPSNGHAAPPPVRSRVSWLAKLSGLRASVATSATSATSETILDDLRSGRE